MELLNKTSIDGLNRQLDSTKQLFGKVEERAEEMQHRWNMLKTLRATDDRIRRRTCDS